MKDKDTMLLVRVNQNTAGILVRDGQEFVFNYSTDNAGQYVSLTMPVRAKSYLNDANKLHPIFEMHLPEGYLLSIIKKHFSKITKTDDFGLLNLLSSNVAGRVSYDNNLEDDSITLRELLHPSSKSLFSELVSRFALSSVLSGVQPKVMAKVEDKATLLLHDYIVKSWGDDYPNLAINEYYCMMVMNKSGVSTPDFYLSDDNTLFISKRFDVKDDGSFLGFEDMCVLQNRQREDKYEGSYERVSKTIKDFVSPEYKKQSLMVFFKMIVVNTMVQNGDAHLKNFGLLYNDTHDIKIAPAFDVVCTTVYVKNDVPALQLLGSKKWHSKDKLLKFAIESCDLSRKEALEIYSACECAVLSVNAEIKERMLSEQDTDVKEFLLLLSSTLS